MEEQLPERDRSLALHIPQALEIPEIPLLSVDLQAMSLTDQGSQSEFHELRQVMLESRPDYIWGIAKLKVGVPVFDRVKLLYSVNEAGITYLNYEKIGRICLFCGVMFHTVGNCHLRQQIVTQKIQSGQADQAQQVPFQRYGSWIIEPADIPSNFAVQGQGSNPIFSAYQIPQLDRSQRASGSAPSKQKTNEESNAVMTRRRLQFDGKSSAMAEEQQLEERTVQPPGRIEGGNQSQSGALISSELHGGHVGWTVGAAPSAGQGILQNNPGPNERSGGPDTVMQQGQFSPSSSMCLTTLPYSLEEEAQILENLGRTAGHGLLLGQQQHQQGTDKTEVPTQTTRIFGPSSSTPDTFHQHDHTSALYLGKEPLQFANTYQITQTAPPANLQSAMDPSAQMLPVASLNSHLFTHSNPATPIPNPHSFSPAKSPSKRSATPLELLSSPAPKRVAPAPGQDGHGGGADLQAPQIPPGGAACAENQILLPCAPLSVIGAGTEQGVFLEGGGAVPAAVQGAPAARGRGGILGARPSISNKSRSNPSLSSARGRARRRPSGWDIPEDADAGASHGALGITHHKPGASTWRRVCKSEEVALGSVGGRVSGPYMGIFGVPNAASNCPSPALSSSTDRADHDPWPLHTPSSSQSVASQDTRHGGFSPPPMAREYYVGVDDCIGSDAAGSQANFQGQVQLGSSSNAATQVVCDDSGRASVEMDLEAAAPGLKAPRVP
ncbi:hypothetical protein ACQ4PT_045101 [Festuca glaucescens]